MYATFFSERTPIENPDFYVNNARAAKRITYSILLNRYESDIMPKYRKAKKDESCHETKAYKRLCEIKKNLEHNLAVLREQLNMK